MTKEELEKEADKWLVNNLHSTEEDYKRAYLANAEPREKQITGLSKHILELQKDKGNLIDRCRELEKRCANYEMTISKMEKGTCDICKETEKDKKIEELEAQIEKMKKYIKACWIEENLNDYSSYITNNSDEFRDLVKEINDEVRNGR